MGDVKGFLNPKIAPYNDITLKTLDTYYLTRSKKVFVVNHPRFLNMFWPAIKAAMPSNIQKKLVLVKNKKEIEDYIDLNILPKKLGGNNPNGANQSEMFLQFQNFVNSLPRKSSTPTRQTIMRSQYKIKMYIDRSMKKDQCSRL